MVNASCHAIRHPNFKSLRTSVKVQLLVGRFVLYLFFLQKGFEIQLQNQYSRHGRIEAAVPPFRVGKTGIGLRDDAVAISIHGLQALFEQRLNLTQRSYQDTSKACQDRKKASIHTRANYFFVFFHLSAFMIPVTKTPLVEDTLDVFLFLEPGIFTPIGRPMWNEVELG